MDEPMVYYEIPECVVFQSVCDVPVVAVVRDSYTDGKVSAFVLNDTGEMIWDQIRAYRSEGEIVRIVSEAFEEPMEIIEKEVHTFLQTMEDQGILLRSGGSV